MCVCGLRVDVRECEPEVVNTRKEEKKNFVCLQIHLKMKRFALPAHNLFLTQCGVCHGVGKELVSVSSTGLESWAAPLKTGV